MNVTRTAEEVQVIHFARGGQTAHCVMFCRSTLAPITQTTITILYYWTQENLRLALLQVTLIATERQK
jgi:hypothetical protein